MYAATMKALHLAGIAALLESRGLVAPVLQGTEEYWAVHSVACDLLLQLGIGADRESDPESAAKLVSAVLYWAWRARVTK